MINDLFSDFVKGKYESGLNYKVPRKLVKYIEKKNYITLNIEHKINMKKIYKSTFIYSLQKFPRVKKNK